MAIGWKAGACASLLALAGCTHIETMPDTQITPPGQALNGHSYALPMLQYQLDITRSLKACPTSVTIAGVGAAKAITITDTSLVFQVKAEPTAHYIPWERYTVDYSALSSFLKTTSWGIVNYPSGVLKSVNVSADDHSAEVLKSAATTVLTVATMASGNPIPALAAAAGAANSGGGSKGGTRGAMGPGGKHPPKVDKGVEQALVALDALADHTVAITCTPEAVAALAAIKANGDKQDTATAALAAATKDVERYTILANLKKARDTDVAGLDDALTRQGARTLDVETLKDERTGLDTAVSVKSTEYWPRAPQDRKVDLPLEPSEMARFERMLEKRQVRTLTPTNLQSWYQGLDKRVRAIIWKKYQGLLKPYVREDGTAIVQRPPVDSACIAADPDIQACVAEAVAISASLTRSTGSIPLCGAGQKPETGCLAEAAIDEKQKTGRFVYDGKPDPGIFIRPPGQGLFIICRPLRTPAARRDAKLEGLAQAIRTKTGVKVRGILADPVPCPSDRRLVRLDAVATPQLGQLRFLPFSSKPFESNQLTFAMLEDGSVESLTYSKTRAAGTEIASTASDIAGQVQSARDKQEAKNATALTDARAAQIADLQFQIDLQTKRAELLKAQTPESPDAAQAIKDEIAQINTETELLNARLSKLQAQAALTAAGGQ